jgi:hypothetical protein
METTRGRRVPSGRSEKGAPLGPVLQLLENRMSSESNGTKPDSQEPPPASGGGRRFSARAPSAWGAARDALAAVHNLDALLRSASVAFRTILDLLPELRSGAEVLSEAFGRARVADAAARSVGEHGRLHVDELKRLLDATEAAQEDRDVLADRARALADQLEASADLLALLERSADPLPTEVSLNLIVRETGRMSATGRGRELAVRFDEASPDCTVTTDPYVIGPLLSLAVTQVHGAELREVTIRARCSPPNATLVVEAATPGDAAVPTLPMRVLPAVPPAEQAAARVAEQMGVLLVVQPMRWAIVLGSAAG